MPVALVHAFAQMLPRIVAEESVRSANAIAFGFGAMKPEDAKRWADQLNAAASGDAAPKRKRATNAEIRELFGGPPAPQDAARAMGIKVVRKAKA